jgi:antitoxin component of RelBE/YafQ-DinJ toxin-antitoxin module
MVPISAYQVTTLPDNDNSTFTFRVSSDLKAEFSKLCKDDHMSASNVLKRYMAQCVSKGRIVK